MILNFIFYKNNNIKMKKIYVWCALTHASENFKSSISQFKNILKNNYEILDFIWLEKWTAKDVFERDTHCVKSCDLLIADCSYPSIWLWIEIWFALHNKKPILAIAHKDCRVTRQVLWIQHFDFEFIQYENLLDLIDIVNKKMQNI